MSRKVMGQHNKEGLGMKQLERRKLIQLAAAFALAPTLICAPLRAQSGLGTIAPPSRAMTYKRKIQRQLSDGAWLSVERSFAVRFIAEASGFRVDGKQIGIEIDAPAALKSIVKLEKARVETGIFPLMLKENGFIESGSTAHEAKQIEAALHEVSQQVLTISGTAEERRELQDFISAFHNVGSNIISNLPVDLFSPERNKRSISREIAMPDGIIGEVTSTFSAQRDPETNLMRMAKREIVTRMEGDTRHTIESWSLLPS